MFVCLESVSAVEMVSTSYQYVLFIIFCSSLYFNINYYNLYSSILNTQNSIKLIFTNTVNK